MSSYHEKQTQLADQPWVLIRESADYAQWIDKIKSKHILPEPPPPPGLYPCLAKYFVEGGMVYSIYLDEEEAIDFLKRVKTVDRLEGDSALPQTQDGWNRQVTALLMSLMQVVLGARLCTKEQFEMMDIRYQKQVDEFVTDHKDQGTDHNTAQFLRKALDLSPLS
jgi:hypothetical protein